MTKPKWKDIDWDVMFKAAPEAQAFMAFENGRVYWSKDVYEEEKKGWKYLIKQHNYIGTYDLEDVNWEDTLVTRPKPNKQEIFENKIYDYILEVIDNTVIAHSYINNIKKIAKEVFGDV